MTVRSFLALLDELDFQKSIDKHIDSTNPKIYLKGLQGSLVGVTIANTFHKSTRDHIILAEDKEEAAYLYNDLQKFVDDKQVFFYPGSYRRPYEIETTDNANILLRAETINQISHKRKHCIIVSYPDALFEKVISRKTLKSHTLSLKIGEKISTDFINETLFEYGFERVDFVSDPGQFSVRGGIVDVFSYSNDLPFRIEFFGDEVEGIRTFEVADQRSVEKLNQIKIIPNIEDKTIGENRISFLNFIRDNSIVWCKNIRSSIEKLDEYYIKAGNIYQEEKSSKLVKSLKPEELFLKGTDFKNQLDTFTCFEFGAQNFFSAENIQLESFPHPSFNRQFNLLIDKIKEWHQEGKTIFIACSGAKQVERFEQIFEELNEENLNYTPILLPLYKGFITENYVCLTDHEIFDRYHKFELKSNKSSKDVFTLKEINKLEHGDYVTHIDHGIGKFGGLQKIEVNGKKQEAIKLIYKNNDILYISIHSLHKISKYNGKEGTEPKIYQLGSQQWSKLKKKTKTKIKTIAYDLIKLYARRKSQKGFQYSPDGYLQHELEASFIYEDTPDQLKSTQDVKRDMESPQPMDRLICGDVGFGKTEIAIRAAFKAVCDNKQVAVLVPTTILALQHYKSFKKRLKRFPCNVDYINRFKSPKQQRETIKKLEEGKIDILIGTHRIVGKDIKFHDLGLLIIDEEQKFGVAVKDKLKTIKANVDTLTLSATPIPRTLQFSMMAARDLSIMTTPPPNRHPIETVLTGFNEEVIRNAISYELQRGGQTYFINNRVENIQEVAGMIQRLCPDARVGIGHGQMSGPKLERLMLEFIEGEFDVLVATTIIENGLDVPNANTILINNAHHFGLSDLHQMRGRVGRSNKKAFCYLVSPPLSSLTPEARKRLQSLEQFSGLGSGFNIAMKDLEIRGAGDILGAEQSGFISDIGFETYHKILNEAVEELKENEFKELYSNADEPVVFVKDCQLDTDLELMIPDDYVNNISERLSLYHQLNACKNKEDLDGFKAELEDRFGAIPAKVHELIQSLPLRWEAQAIGFEKIVLKANKLIAYFIKDSDSDYFQSEQFGFVLQAVQQNHKRIKIKEKNQKLSLVADKIDSIEAALSILSTLKSEVFATVKQE
jgi:transcription-repair coupling factor (superfamily II helicase)